jgi:hypothetical protein
MVAMESTPPESRRTIVLGVVGEMSLISGFASKWCHMVGPPKFVLLILTKFCTVHILALITG